MIDAYVDYTFNGEGCVLAEIDEPNDPYFRYFTSGYGMSQAYGDHKRHQAMRTAMSEGEKQRLLGENLNGTAFAYELPTHYSSWLSYFKPAYDERRDQYQNDPNNFDPDVDWPIDGDPVTGGWFREPLDVNVTDITSSSATITWTTPEPADSYVIYTSTGTWWYWQEGGPDGYEHKDKVDRVTDHTINLPPDGFEDLDLNTWYEYRIRSTNDPNEEPNIPDQIIWGYVGKFKTLPQ